MSIVARLLTVLAACLPLSTLAMAATPLATTTLTFFASGSPNTITGNWSAPPLDIADGDTVEYYSVKVLSFESAYGISSSYTLTSYFPGDSTSLSLAQGCPLGISCIGEPYVGSVSIASLLSPAQPQALSFLSRLDPDSPRYAADRQVSVFFNSGGGTTTATGTLEITAFGTAAIPEPAPILLLAAGLAGVMAMRRRNGWT